MSHQKFSAHFKGTVLPFWSLPERKKNVSIFKVIKNDGNGT
jgi:hypothetical protein